MIEPGPRRLPFVVALALLCLRGVLLWVVVPLGSLAWLAGWPAWHRRRVKLAQFLGWLDLNLIAVLERSLLRPFVKDPLARVPLARAHEVTHRISSMDLA